MVVVDTDNTRTQQVVRPAFACAAANGLGDGGTHPGTKK